MKSKTVLVVAAHPDDEMLGCGGSMIRHVLDGDMVYVAFASDGHTSRNDGDSHLTSLSRNKLAEQVCLSIGAAPPFFLGFADNKMDQVPLINVVKPVEQLIDKLMPTIIYTHHAHDLNIDHRLTHQAVMTAARPLPSSQIREIYSFETLSSTEWNTPSPANAFAPNFFVDITATFELKIKAMKYYQSEMRKYPHSRSIKALESLAIVRGASVGVRYAEAFVVNRIIR